MQSVQLQFSCAMRSYHHLGLLSQGLWRASYRRATHQYGRRQSADGSAIFGPHPMKLWCSFVKTRWMNIGECKMLLTMVRRAASYCSRCDGHHLSICLLD